MKHINYIVLASLSAAVLLLMSVPTCTDKTPSEPEYTITILPEGGEYTCPNGIILRVPAGAVTRETDITLKKVNGAKLAPIFKKRGVSVDNLLACIDGTPDGTVFNLPIQLILSVDLEPGDIPFVHEVDLADGSYTPAETEIICDPNLDILEISISHFSTLSAEILREIRDLFGECAIDPCRCGRVKVVQSDKDYICDNGDCEVTQSKVTVTFLDCPGTPVE